MFFEVSVARDLGRRTIALEFASDAVVTALVGPSGSGKTTVLNMIAGIGPSGQGRIAVGGRLLFDSENGVAIPPERRRCGYVFQETRLFPHMSVRDNLLYGRRRAAAGELVGYDAVLALLDLAALEARRPTTLSGGEARRVAIGRTLLSNPSFLLLDEPLTSLDAERRDDTMAVFERLRDAIAIPILYVTHQADEVSRIAGRVIEMPAGR